MLKLVEESLSAGILIAAGGSVFLACDNSYIGAFLFSVALLCICYLGYFLYTGRIGYLAEDFSGRKLASLAVGLLGNLVAAFFSGPMIRYALPQLGERAATLCTAKLEQSFSQTFVRALFCDILMYLAVQIFRKDKTPIGILFCVPVFILSGFEHSIADMFYFGAAGLSEAKILSFEAAAILGNSLGSLILPTLKKAGDKYGR